jgi:dTDP-4-amino-4,6-dideoxygalactose transaminase
LARRLRALRNHGLDPAAASPDFILPGYNLRLTEFQAALGLTQMNKLDTIIAGRRAAAARYDALLSGSSIIAPCTPTPAAHVYQSYVVLLAREAAGDRAGIIAALREQGIETTIGTYHMPLTTHFRSRGLFQAGDFPVTDDIAARALTLPLYPSLDAAQQRYVVDALLSQV